MPLTPLGGRHRAGTADAHLRRRVRKRLRYEMLKHSPSVGARGRYSFQRASHRSLAVSDNRAWKLLEAFSVRTLASHPE